MSDFFRKLNTLVKAGVNDVFSDIPPNRTQRGPVSPKKLQSEIDRLRDRINQAIAYEDDLQARIYALQREIDQLDLQADEALMQGNDAVARHLVERIQREQQRMTILEADLRAHQLVAQDLILQVNRFEAALVETRVEDNAPAVTPEREAAAEEHHRRVIDRIDSVIKETQQRIRRHDDAEASVSAETASALRDEQSEQRDTTVDEDLSQRRQRLSKR